MIRMEATIMNATSTNILGNINYFLILTASNKHKQQKDDITLYDYYTQAIPDSFFEQLSYILYFAKCIRVDWRSSLMKIYNGSDIMP